MKRHVYKVTSRYPDGEGVLGYFVDFSNAMCFARAWSDQKEPYEFNNEKYSSEGGHAPGYANFIDDCGFCCVVSEAAGKEGLFD